MRNISDGKIIKITFVFSLLTHCLFLGMPGFNLNKPQPKKPEEIPVQIEIKIPPLLPKIDVMGEKKKLKEVEQKQKEPKIESKSRSEEKEITQESKPRKQIEEVTSKKEVIEKPKPEPQPKEEEIVKEPEPKERIEKVALKQEIIEKPESKEIKETVKVKNPQDEAMLRYQDIIKQRIESCRRYPNWAKKQGIEGTVYIAFTVLSNGSNRDVKMIRSSGSMILDEEAIATIKRANPFPPIPKEISNSFVRMDISIVFTLK